MWKAGAASVARGSRGAKRLRNVLRYSGGPGRRGDLFPSWPVVVKFTVRHKGVTHVPEVRKADVRCPWEWRCKET